MRITQAQLRRAVGDIYEPNIDQFVASFNMFAGHFGINTPLRVIHYLSQILHESGRLKYTEENLNYSADGLLKVFPLYFKKPEIAAAYARKPQQIANKVYANRMGNGSEESGDGWKYKGRGFLQLSGKNNYKAFSKFDLCTEDVVEHPEKVAEYPLNQTSAMWFWEAHKLNEKADRDNGMNTSDICTQITKVINGGTNGLSDRLFVLRRLKKEFGI